jgi:hypothetical protein
MAGDLPSLSDQAEDKDLVWQQLRAQHAARVPAPRGHRARRGRVGTAEAMRQRGAEAGTP